MTDTTAGPIAAAITGMHHFSPTVSDVEKSAAWYERVFGMTRVPVPFPHWENEDSGFATLLMDARSGIAIGLHHHEVNEGEQDRHREQRCQRRAEPDRVLHGRVPRPRQHPARDLLHGKLTGGRTRHLSASAAGFC